MFRLLVAVRPGFRCSHLRRRRFGRRADGSVAGRPQPAWPRRVDQSREAHHPARPHHSPRGLGNGNRPFPSPCSVRAGRWSGHPAHRRGVGWWRAGQVLGVEEAGDLAAVVDPGGGGARLAGHVDPAASAGRVTGLREHGVHHAERIQAHRHAGCAVGRRSRCRGSSRPRSRVGVVADHVATVVDRRRKR
jgi:hypothetical protein